MSVDTGSIKKHAAIVLTLIAVVSMVTVVYAGIRRAMPGMQVRFNKRDFPEQDLHIIAPVDLAFEASIADYFKGNSNESFETLKPFSVFIKNSGEKSVVAYALVWQLVKRDGTVLTNTTSYSEPGILMGDEVPSDPRFRHTQTIEPNSMKCLSWSGAIDGGTQSSLGGTASGPSRDQPVQDTFSAGLRDQLDADLLQASDITVSLDGVFFDDGTFVGPNVSGFFERIQAMVSAKLDLISEIALANEQGKVEEAFDSVRAKGVVADVKITSESTPEDYYRYYSKLFAGEISAMKMHYGNAGLVARMVNSKKRARILVRK